MSDAISMFEQYCWVLRSNNAPFVEAKTFGNLNELLGKSFISIGISSNSGTFSITTSSVSLVLELELVD